MLWKIPTEVLHPEEYGNLIRETQTDKNKTMVCLYVDDPVEKASFVEARAPRDTTCW